LPKCDTDTVELQVVTGRLA